VEEEHKFGQLDGQAIDVVLVGVRGTGSLDRWPAEGEKVILSVEGSVKFKSVKRENGVLIRELVLLADTIAEPIGRLAEETGQWLSEIEDLRQGRTALPFDEEEGDTE